MFRPSLGEVLLLGLVVILVFGGRYLIDRNRKSKDKPADEPGQTGTN